MRGLFEGFSDRGREDEIRDALGRRLLVLDGAMGTRVQAHNPAAADFGGADLDGCNENLVLTRPEWIAAIHREYLEAGADIVETNSFGAVRHVLAEYGIQDKVRAIAFEAARIARAEADRLSTASKPRFVAGALGPGTKSILISRGIGFSEVREAYAEASRGLVEGGADFLLLETQQDALNAKASLLGFDDAFRALGRSVPVAVSVSIESMGTMLCGQTAEALVDALSHARLLALGLNCATGPAFMTDHLRTIAELSTAFTICYPNAGLPDERGLYHETPAGVAKALERFAQEGWLNIVGGCCGTTPEHTTLIARLAAGHFPRKLPAASRPAVSGLESLPLEQERPPILVGERTNVIGSRLFKERVAAGDFDGAAEIGRRQLRAGAHVLDVCLADPDREERVDMAALLEPLVRKIKAPVMVDSTDARVIEEALQRTPGKSIVNSVNLEDGEERFESVVPLLRLYGGAVVVGTIDEDKAAGMALTRERKLAIARRSFELLTRKYGMPPGDIIFDPLVFPAATGDKNYWGSAVETVEGVRLIKREIAGARTILGISNVSFGLPPAGREVLNSVFLHLCVEAGLDLAIVNTERLAPFSRIPPQDAALSLDLLRWKGPGDPAFPAGFDPVQAFSERFRGAKPAAKTPDGRAKLPVGERLARAVVEGSRDGLTEDLAEISRRLAPLDIINGPLMKGMDEVGRLFAENRMIVAEVLQSAEVMKAAVAWLEPRMAGAERQARGRIVLATVKGDVHDIGKNLVHIILKNNGYEVTDLGIKVSPEAVIEAARAVKADLIGLSGLLVKSTQQMVVTAEDLEAAGVDVPLLVGGAALSAKFTASRIAPAYDGPVLYAKDAMTGLDLANRLRDPGKRRELLAKNREIQELLSVQTVPRPSAAAPAAPAAIRHDFPSAVPPDLKPHLVEDAPVEEIFRYINPIMLYGRHLGLKGNLESLIAENNARALELIRRVSELEAEIASGGLLRPRAVYRFFAAASRGDDLMLYESPGDQKPAETFRFPRQAAGERLCLSDFVRPPAADGTGDFVALFVVTCGSGVLERSRALREEGEYFKSHALQAIAIESAEAYAELLHERLRRMWGFPDPASMTLKEKFQARYRGLRVSFGYPACPDLSDQAKLFRLLDAERRTGVALTEGFMMDPEASVSGLVFQHPQARYFSVGAPVP